MNQNAAAIPKEVPPLDPLAFVQARQWLRDGPPPPSRNRNYAAYNDRHFTAALRVYRRLSQLARQVRDQRDDDVRPRLLDDERADFVLTYTYRETRCTVFLSAPEWTLLQELSQMDVLLPVTDQT